MRSVDKGAAPEGESGQPVIFEPYGKAAPYLKRVLGRWCSFCERFVATSLAVEHKLPKATYPELAHDWTNFLLGCSNCNSTKGTREQGSASPLWPDEEDTSNLVEYHRSGAIRPRADLGAAQKGRVEALLGLVGLSKQPKELGPGDHRFDDRMEVWSLAEQALTDLDAQQSEAMRANVVKLAAAKGGYSIWTTVFANDGDMLERLAAAHPGTRVNAN
jgi:uncharacterized protein (TIGR02646 family)